MSAYFIANVQVHDAAVYERYVAGVPESIAKFGGAYLARGGEATRLEGTWEPRRIVILSFSDTESAQRWYKSDEYQAMLCLRQAAASTDMILVEGLPARQSGRRGITRDPSY